MQCRESVRSKEEEDMCYLSPSLVVYHIVYEIKINEIISSDVMVQINYSDIRIRYSESDIR